MFYTELKVDVKVSILYQDVVTVIAFENGFSKQDPKDPLNAKLEQQTRLF